MDFSIWIKTFGTVKWCWDKIKISLSLLLRQAFWNCRYFSTIETNFLLVLRSTVSIETRQIKTPRLIINFFLKKVGSLSKNLKKLLIKMQKGVRPKKNFQNPMPLSPQTDQHLIYPPPRFSTTVHLVCAQVFVLFVCDVIRKSEWPEKSLTFSVSHSNILS
jgi:hypothetical protein